MEAAQRPRFLIDQNLSPRLVTLLADTFPGSTHALHVGLGEAPDRQLQDWARRGGFTILTKDADHAELARRRASPPHVLWIRLGNCTTRQVTLLLRERQADIVELERGLRGPVLELP